MFSGHTSRENAIHIWYYHIKHSDEVNVVTDMNHTYSKRPTIEVGSEESMLVHNIKGSNGSKSSVENETTVKNSEPTVDVNSENTNMKGHNASDLDPTVEENTKGQNSEQLLDTKGQNIAQPQDQNDDKVCTDNSDVNKGSDKESSDKMG